VASPLAEARLVPDDVVMALVRERLLRDGTRRGLVLDGFPRNLAQAQALDRELEKLELQLSVVLCTVPSTRYGGKSGTPLSSSRRHDWGFHRCERGVDARSLAVLGLS
jgi:hypothetical protein